MIYLDHHATTPCDPRVLEKMLPFFSEIFGNPAAIVHEHGRAASRAVEDARIAIAKFFGVLSAEIYFTAGATESNNIALRIAGRANHVITSAMEHKSVLAPLHESGAELTILRPDREGFIAPDAVRASIRSNTKLISIEAANGEIGTLQNIDAIGAIARERGILLHSDITQAAGKVPVNLSNVDLASFSAHKVYGPKGIGGLFVRRGIKVPPLIVGGGQERNMRSGTVNVPGVIGLAAALQLRATEMEDEARRLTSIRNDLWDGLTAKIPDVSVHGPRDLRLPGNLNVSFDRVEAESLILGMRRFSLSSGSACSTGERGPSRVLTAIGVGEAAAMGSIRIGLGTSNTAEHAAMLIDDLTRMVTKLRQITA